MTTYKVHGVISQKITLWIFTSAEVFRLKRSYGCLLHRANCTLLWSLLVVCPRIFGCAGKRLVERVRDGGGEVHLAANCIETSEFPI